MMMKFYAIVFTGVQYLAFVGAARAEENPAEQGWQLKQMVLDARLALADGYARFTTIDPTGRRIRWTAWFKGTNRLRVDQEHPPHKMLQVEGDLFDWAGVPGGPLLQPVRRNLDDPVQFVFDFRVLGTVFTATSFHNSKLGDNLVRDGGTVDPMVQSVMLDGREVKLVTTRYPSGAVLRQWIDLERGPSIIQAEAEGTSEKSGRHYLERVVSRLHNYNGVWFPDRIVYTRHVNHNPLGSSYVTTIEHAEFNTGLEDDLFTLAALGVPPGLAVQEFPPFAQGQRIWDGKQLVVEHARAPVDRMDVHPPTEVGPDVRSVLIWVNLIAGSACLGVFAYRWLRNRCRC